MNPSREIRDAQQGRVMYPGFKARPEVSGCVGYTVWLTERHVVYLGRRGERHVERFPDGAPAAIPRQAPQRSPNAAGRAQKQNGPAV